jgi:curved DNA-binding protein
MADENDLYEILGVARDADHDDIRKTYRRLARENHPDLNPGDNAAEERFKQISRAWEVLSDPAKRQSYDEFGEISLDSGFDAEAARRAKEAFGSRFGEAGRAGGGRYAEEFEFGGIDDLFGNLFGGAAAGRGGRGAPRMRGGDVEAELELDFLDAVRGGEKRLSLGRPDASGGLTTQDVTVRIPPGVDANGRLRIPGKGGLGLGGGPPGDLWVTLRVRPHRFFRRDGKNLEFDLPITVREAIEGGPVEVPTLDGRATLTIPPGTDGGTRLRLRGKGVPDPRGGAPGDLFARVRIRVPRDVDDDTRALLDGLARPEDDEIRKELFS